MLVGNATLALGTLASFARACGEALAKAHARSGDPEATPTSVATFTEAMQRFARTYADRNEADHAALVALLALR